MFILEDSFLGQWGSVQRVGIRCKFFFKPIFYQFLFERKRVKNFLVKFKLIKNLKSAFSKINFQLGINIKNIFLALDNMAVINFLLLYFCITLGTINCVKSDINSNKTQTEFSTEWPNKAFVATTTPAIKINQ